MWDEWKSDGRLQITGRRLGKVPQGKIASQSFIHMHNHIAAVLSLRLIFNIKIFFQSNSSLWPDNSQGGP